VKFKYNVKLGERFSNITADIMGIKTNGQVMAYKDRETIFTTDIKYQSTC
jgi:hypothetical protein